MQPTDAVTTMQPTDAVTTMQPTDVSVYHEDGFTEVAIVILMVPLAICLLLTIIVTSVCMWKGCHEGEDS